MKTLQVMKTFLLIFFAFFVLPLAVFNGVNAQGTVVTSPPVNGTTQWGGITFNLQTSQSVVIDTIYVNTSGSAGSTVNLEIWYNPSAINGQPAAFTGAPWLNVIANQSLPAGVDLVPIFIPGGLTVPAGSNWGFYIGDVGFTNTGIRYGSSSTVSTVTDGVVTIEMGTNVGYGWVRNTSTTSNHPRFFAGGLSYDFAAACTGTPVAGIASAPANVCANQNFSLSLSGNTSATNLAYQWMSSPSATGPWTPVAGATSLSATVSHITDTYYRCEVTCTNSSMSDNSSVVFVQTSPNLAAGTYTVGAGGDYATFTAATAALSCGIAGPVVFNALPGAGPFNEQVIIPEIINTSAVNTVTYNGNGETLTSTTTTSDRSLFLLDGSDYVTINGFNLVTQSDINNFVVQLTNDADYNTVSNNTVNMASTITSTNSNNVGILLSGSLTSATSTTGASGSNNTITGNTITGGYYGINVNGQNGVFSESNTISDNILEDFYSYGISMRYAKDNVIADNDISRPNRVTVSSFYGMYFASGGEGQIVSGNYIHTPFGGITGTSTSVNYGIYMTANDAPLGNETKVFNNIIHLTGNNGTIYGIYTTSSDGVYFYYNTIVLDDASATSGITRGFYQTTAATNNEFKNNIVSITRGGSGDKYCLYFNTASSSIISDNNVLYMNSAGGGSNNVGYYGSAQLTLADWQTASNGDANSIESDPVLINSALLNQVPSGALANNIGVPIAGITLDFGGNLRNTTTPDPGAHEFAPPTCPQASLLSAINITSNSLDLEWIETGSASTWNIEWGLSGFALGSGTSLSTTSNPHSFTNLNASTQYDFYVQSDCGGGDLSTWAGPFTIYTSCGVIVAPYYEGFNNAVQPQCWENLSSTVSSSINNLWNFNKQGEYGALDNGKAIGTFVSSDGSTPNPDSMYLITPEIDISQLTTPYLSFEWFSNNTNTPGDNVPLIVSVFDGTSWSLLDTLIGDSPDWEFVNYDLSAYSNNIIKVRFMTNQSVPGTAFYNDILLDEVRIADCISLGGQDGTLDVCRFDNTVDLNNNIIVKPNGGGEWSFPNQPNFLSDSIFTVTYLPSGSYEVYYVERYVCFDTTIATINVFNKSSAGIDGSIMVCKNEPINLYGVLGGNVDFGGDWYDFSNTLLPNSQPKAQPIPGQYNYTYIVSNGVCPADTAIVEVGVLAECDFLALGEELFTDISVYPNPATTQLNIVNPSNTSSLKVEMLDMNGRVVLVENKALNNASEATLVIEHLERGIYTLRVYNNEGQKTFKIVKQ